MNIFSKKNFPTTLTYSRIVLSPIVMVLICWDTMFSAYAGTAVFILLALTDWLDGFFSRKWNTTSSAGKLLDPLADKVLVHVALLGLVYVHKISPLILAIFVVRDGLMHALRIKAAAKKIIIEARLMGKIKMVLQMIAIPLLILKIKLFTIPFNSMALGILWMSVALSILSLFNYYKNYLSKKFL